LSHDHLEGAVKNLLAFENHASSDGCPHCMTKHLLITEQLLEEENQQRPQNGFSDLIARVKDLRKLRLPKAYDGEYVKSADMELVSKEARGIRLEVMKRAGLPMHSLDHVAREVVRPHSVSEHRRMEHQVVA